MNHVASVVARLEVAGLAPVVAELARRFEDGSPVTQITVSGLDHDQRASVADLLGRDRLPGPTLRIALHTLVSALGLDCVEELRTAVEVMTGPLGNRRADRDKQQRTAAQLWSWCAEQATGVPFLSDSDGVARGWTYSARPVSGVDPTARSPTATGWDKR